LKRTLSQQDRWAKKEIEDAHYGKHADEEDEEEYA